MAYVWQISGRGRAKNEDLLYYASGNELLAFVETKVFYRPPEVSPSRQGYHRKKNAETYFLSGESMDKVMLSLLDH